MFRCAFLCFPWCRWSLLCFVFALHVFVLRLLRVGLLCFGHRQADPHTTAAHPPRGIDDHRGHSIGGQAVVPNYNFSIHMYAYTIVRVSRCFPLRSLVPLVIALLCVCSAFLCFAFASRWLALLWSWPGRPTHHHRPPTQGG